FYRHISHSKYALDPATRCPPSPATYNAYAPTASSRYASHAATHTHPSTNMPLTMLKFTQHPLDMPLTLPPKVPPHPSAAYHAYAPAAPSIYASEASTPCLPHPSSHFRNPASSSLLLTILMHMY
ncbi:hypothetical protein O181_031478, partial [Austropuccinia psidii MF-1]|nr:hypothetical protein [Austropuccinia psidii MF-1]